MNDDIPHSHSRSYSSDHLITLRYYETVHLPLMGHTDRIPFPVSTSPPPLSKDSDDEDSNQHFPIPIVMPLVKGNDDDFSRPIILTPEDLEELERVAERDTVR